MGNGSGEGEMVAGKVTEFVRVGDEVLRPATANTESMRQLLAHLEDCNFEGAPRAVDSEPDGALRLTWIDGWAPDEAEAWKLDAEALESVGQLLRQYHDNVKGFAPETGFEEGPQAVAEGDIVCHGDIANVLVVCLGFSAVDCDGSGVPRKAHRRSHTRSVRQGGATPRGASMPSRTRANKPKTHH